jgi:hypothetical protein
MTAAAAESDLRKALPHSLAGGHNPWLVALVVSIATFMEVLDTSIANVSLNHIAGELSASLDESTWGAHQLPRFQRDRIADQWVACQCDWAQTLLHGVCFSFHRQLVSLRNRAVAGVADHLSRAAGIGRRRTGAKRAIDPGGFISA